MSGRHPGIPLSAPAEEAQASGSIAFQMGHLWGNQAVAEHSGTSPWKEKGMTNGARVMKGGRFSLALIDHRREGGDCREFGDLRLSSPAFSLT